MGTLAAATRRTTRSATTPVRSGPTTPRSRRCGLVRDGRTRRAAALLRALVDAATHFDVPPPELFGGSAGLRSPGPLPRVLPTAGVGCGVRGRTGHRQPRPRGRRSPWPPGDAAAASLALRRPLRAWPACSRRSSSRSTSTTTGGCAPCALPPGSTSRSTECTFRPGRRVWTGRVPGHGWSGSRRRLGGAGFLTAHRAAYGEHLGQVTGGPGDRWALCRSWRGPRSSARSGASRWGPERGGP